MILILIYFINIKSIILYMNVHEAFDFNKVDNNN